MRKTTLALCLSLAAAGTGCERTATAAEQRRTASEAPHASASVAAVPQVATASVRRVVPGLVSVRALVADGPVTLIVRTTNGLGWPTLTSGVEIIRYDQPYMVETQIQTTPGFRYLLIAVPGESDPALIDYSKASFTEFLP